VHLTSGAGGGVVEVVCVCVRARLVEVVVGVGMRVAPDRVAVRPYSLARGRPEVVIDIAVLSRKYKTKRKEKRETKGE